MCQQTKQINEQKTESACYISKNSNPNAMVNNNNKHMRDYFLPGPSREAD